MPQVCSVCRHARRVEIEQALLNRTTLRTISERFGPSKTALLRHREHIASTLAPQTQAREAVRSRTLLQDVHVSEGRVERLYTHAEAILNSALHDQDRRSALAAIRAAVDVMAEARNLMQVRGELTGELQREANLASLQIQIICPGVSDPANPPRVAFASVKTIDASAEQVEDSTQEIALTQG
jgi:hypothetical protein